MFVWKKPPNLSRQAFFGGHRNFCSNSKIGASSAFCYFACWILKTKRRETSDVADFHRESARKGRVAAENRRSFIYCGGRHVAEAGLVRSILLITGRSSEHFPNPTQPSNSNPAIRYLPFFNPGPHTYTHRSSCTWIPIGHLQLRGTEEAVPVLPSSLWSSDLYSRRYISYLSGTSHLSPKTLSQSSPGTSLSFQIHTSTQAHTP